VLRRLDAERKGSVLQFLHESGLIVKDKHIIDLRGANLGGANLFEAELSGADLRRADLLDADPEGAIAEGGIIIDRQTLVRTAVLIEPPLDDLE